MGIQMTGLASGLDTGSIIDELMEVEQTRIDEVEKDLQEAEWLQDEYSEVNTMIYEFYTDTLFEMKLAGSYNTTSLTSSDESVATVNDSPNAVDGNHSISVTQMAQGSYLTSNELASGTTSATEIGDLATFSSPATLSFSLDGGTTTYDISVSSTDTISDVISNIDDLGLDLNANYDSENNRFFFSSEEMGDEVTLNVSSSSGDLLVGLGFTTDNTVTSVDGTTGQDAIYEYNGTTLTGDSNDITVNGLSLTLVGVGDVNVSVSTDVDAVYDKVKNFITNYNELIEELNERVDADAATDYEPLTDDEKADMTDDEIELWEDTIKDSLLRNDDTLEAIVSSMRYTLSGYATDDADTIYNSLSEIGIVTGNYSENGQLHINGDEDDSMYSSYNNDLYDAIEENPDDVMELIRSMAEDIYEDLTDRMSSTVLSSALNVFNDKYVDNEIEDYEDEIDDLEDYFVDLEDRYYSQFTAMELAIQELNSQSSYFSSMLSS